MTVKQSLNVQKADAMQTATHQTHRADTVSSKPQPPYTCKYCGAPSWLEPCDQTPPPDYCHESDHGEEEYDWDGRNA
ncbi:hypothetical protein HDN1F_35350 [gamma proteobacterium HdN1]|nr:Probably phage related protein [gamma proteobacterium HdN1]CBL47118.1 hypothetical protein HDN1F_35350 [gamma proteobacterium HdN1]